MAMLPYGDRWKILFVMTMTIGAMMISDLMCKLGVKLGVLVVGG